MASLNDKVSLVPTTALITARRPALYAVTSSQFGRARVLAVSESRARVPTQTASTASYHGSCTQAQSFGEARPSEDGDAEPGGSVPGVPGLEAGRFPRTTACARSSPEPLADDPFSGDVFAFFKAAKDQIKVLVRNRIRFQVLYKRLERESVPTEAAGDGGRFEVEPAQWTMLSPWTVIGRAPWRRRRRRRVRRGPRSGPRSCTGR